MPIVKHDLVREFPEFHAKITELKTSDNHFARLFEQYDEITHAVYRAETEVEPTTDEHLEEMKKERLNLKDQLFDMLKDA